jgi:hypothetical protein
MDTDTATRRHVLTLLDAVPPGERLARALALSAFVRDLAWAGARLEAEHLGTAAVVARFLCQLYGPESAARLDALRGPPRGE